jgi:hypothetical protein
VFKIKLKELINDIHKKHILGRTITRIYVIEFQKCGLPHAHIVIFFAKDYKLHMVEDVDRVINAQLSNPETNKLAHETVVRCMMHDPCGVTFPNAPCMEDGKCKKQHPCKFQFETMTNVNEYPIYRCRNTRCTILVHDVELDNHWVVLHNVYLLTNMMRTSTLRFATTFVQSSICSSMFTKGHDHAIIEISCQSDNATKGNVVKANEIKKYLDCHYVFASKSTWCIFKFDMHERFLVVERLQYHLPNQ